MIITKFPKGDSKCICDNCNKTGIKLIEMDKVRVWLCNDCSKELLVLIKK